MHVHNISKNPLSINMFFGSEFVHYILDCAIFYLLRSDCAVHKLVPVPISDMTQYCCCDNNM